MTSIARSLPSITQKTHLRPFDPGRDMVAVADLIELGFVDTLDDDGQRYLNQMRNAAGAYQNFGLFGFAGRYSMAGYVWEEDGRIIGNLSLIPHLLGARRCFLIANVVVHPDFRRRGIARALTARAIEHAKNAAAPSAWLHVRAENSAALTLYESLGFLERARRTTWQSAHRPSTPVAEADLNITPRQKHHWDLQRAWLRANYPAELGWSLALNLNYLRPGLFGGLARLLGNAYLNQWAVERAGKLCGVAAWQLIPGHSSALWLAAPSDADETAIQSLLMYACKAAESPRPISLDYPAGLNAPAIQAAGFRERQTLIWMEIKFS